jgi:hypothetical protein
MEYNTTYKIFVLLQNIAFYCSTGSNQLFFYFLSPALLLLLVEWILRHTRFRRLP